MLNRRVVQGTFAAALAFISIWHVVSSHNTVNAQSTSMSQAIVNAPGCTTGASGSTCTAIVNWPVSFSDSNYAAECTTDSFLGSGELNWGVAAPIQSQDAASMTIIVRNNSGSPAAFTQTNFKCIGVHN
jgi:hypothetical protein